METIVLRQAASVHAFLLWLGIFTSSCFLDLNPRFVISEHSLTIGEDTENTIGDDTENSNGDLSDDDSGAGDIVDSSDFFETSSNSSESTNDDTTGAGSASTSTGNDEITGTTGSSSDGSDTGDDTSGTSTSGNEFDPNPNLAFVSSVAYKGGEIGGLTQADSLCQQRANVAGLSGTYRAWLSDLSNNAVDRLMPARGWVRTDGKFLVDQLDDLSNHRFYHTLSLDEFGQPLPEFSYVWTGTSNGTASGQGQDMCGGWTESLSNRSAVVGDLETGSKWWSSRYLGNCDDPYHLYCFGTDYTHALSPPSIEGRIVFASKDSFDLNVNGRQVADDLCASEAAAAGLPGTFLSFLAVDGSAPVDRFDMSGPPWVRPDGIVVFTDGIPTDLWSMAPLILDATGANVTSAMAWAGSSHPATPGTAVGTCNNWKDASGFSRLISVWHNRWYDWGLDGTTEECTSSFRVICLEE